MKRMSMITNLWKLQGAARICARHATSQDRQVHLGRTYIPSRSSSQCFFPRTVDEIKSCNLDLVRKCDTIDYLALGAQSQISHIKNTALPLQSL